MTTHDYIAKFYIDGYQIRESKVSIGEMFLFSKGNDLILRGFKSYVYSIVSVTYDPSLEYIHIKLIPLCSIEEFENA